MDNYQKIFRARPSNYRLVNYEAEVYKLIYGRDPLSNLQLNYRRPKKEYRSLYWDNMIPEKAIDELMVIPKIEYIDANQGRDSKLLTHFIFRPINQDQEYVENVAQLLNSGSTKAKLGVGVGGKLIIYIATKNWYRPDGNNETLIKWWNELPNKIKKTV